MEDKGTNMRKTFSDGSFLPRTTMATETTRTRDEWRRIMLHSIEAVAPVFEADALEGDRLRDLPPASLAALRGSELFKLKYPLM